MNLNIIKILVAFVAIYLNSGCTTSTLNLSAKNETDYPLVLSATLLNDAKDKEGSLIHQESISSGKPLPSTEIGKFDKKKYVEIKASLPDGPVIKKDIKQLNNDPTDINFIISKNDIGLKHIELTNPSSIENQIISITGSYETPTTDIGSFVNQYLGGIYIMKEESGVIKFSRIYSLSELYGKPVPADDFIPQSSKKGSFSLSTITDESNRAMLQAQFPNFNLSLSVKGGDSKFHKYLFEVQSSAWHALPFGWNTVERKLRQTEDGIEILKNLISIQQNNKIDLYFLTEAFVFESVNIETFKAESLKAEAKLAYADFIDAGIAYHWKGDTEDKKHANNLVFRVKYQTLFPITDLKLKQEKAPEKENPNQSVEYKVINP